METLRLTTAQALVKFLENQYVEVDGKSHKFVEGILGIFGHGNVTGIGEALEFEKPNLEFIQGHNEQGMVHTATAFAKQNARLKIMACTSSVGPGALNMVTGAATATTNRIPVLILPGDTFACRQPDPVLQQLEVPHDYTQTVNDCFKPVSRYWDRVTRPEQLMSAMLNAMRVLTCQVNTGAVTICLPQDVQAEAYDYPMSFFKKRIHYIDRVLPNKRAIQLAVDKIRGSRRPLIIAGGGVLYSKASQALTSFANQFAIPVCVTQAGKGAIACSNNYCVGGIGVTGTEAANVLAKNADVIIAVGTRLSDFTTCSKTAFAVKHEIVHINVDALDGNKMDAHFIHGDAKATLLRIKIELEKLDYKSIDKYQMIIEQLQSKWQLEIAQCYNKKNKKGIEQTAVLGVLNNFVSNQDVVVCSAGSLPGDLHRLWTSNGPHTYHVEYAFSCMGYEVAGGLGVKIANPSREVYVVVGDGSYLMLHSELLTSLENNYKINIILLDNKGYQCISNLQKANGSRGFGNQFNKSVDYQAMAKAMGVKAYFAKDLDSLEAALYASRDELQSTLIEVKVLPDSMSRGYASWWRVDVAQVSKDSKVTDAYQNMQKKLVDAREY